MSTKKRKYFSVTARVVSINSIDITADSLEDAVTKSKELKSEQFVKDLGDALDGSFSIIQVSESGAWEY